MHGVVVFDIIKYIFDKVHFRLIHGVVVFTSLNTFLVKHVVVTSQIAQVIRRLLLVREV